ncbi:hypothetical protein WBG78_25040 [Chryseolinea sp. T2]|uniref:hypothetical protein n=1 Tax=Chryseolinea sp. T2 TaxID=3129255 RepID=UPI003077E2C0
MKRKSRYKKRKRHAWDEKTREEVTADMIRMFEKAAEAFLYENDEPNIPGLLECLTPHFLEEKEKHWTQIQLARILHQEGDFDTSFNLINQAMRVSHTCPEARWQLGCILGARYGQLAEAIQVWTDLLCTPIRKLAYQSCSICNPNSIQFARRIVRDCKFGLSVAYSTAGYPVLARHYKVAYMRDGERGIGSSCFAEDLD